MIHNYLSVRGVITRTFSAEEKILGYRIEQVNYESHRKASVSSDNLGSLVRKFCEDPRFDRERMAIEPSEDGQRVNCSKTMRYRRPATFEELTRFARLYQDRVEERLKQK